MLLHSVTTTRKSANKITQETGGGGGGLKARSHRGNGLPHRCLKTKAPPGRARQDWIRFAKYPTVTAQAWAYAGTHPILSQSSQLPVKPAKAGVCYECEVASTWVPLEEGTS